MAEEQKMRKFTLKDLLIDEFNKHLIIYAKAFIEAKYTAGRDPNEIVVTLIQPSGNPQVPGVERKIKSKEAQSKAVREVDKQHSVLRVIERLIKEEETKETKFE